MRYMNLYANKMLEDLVAYRAAPFARPTQQLKDWLGYVKHGDAKTAHGYANHGENDKHEHNPNRDAFVRRHVGKVERYAARGARAGYLVGCALTSTTDLLFGTPETTCQTPRQRKSRPSHDGRRVGYGIFRPKPTFDPVALNEGMVGSLYARVGSIVQWLGGNAGALVGAVGFALVQGVQYGARRLGHALFAQYIEPPAPLSRRALAADIKRAAQKADAVGAAVFGLPLYFSFGMAIGGALLVSASLKGVSATVGALVGTCVAGIDNLIYGDKDIRKASKGFWLATRARARAITNDVIDTLDSKAGLHRAMLAAAKRDINPDDVIEVLELHHVEEDY